MLQRIEALEGVTGVIIGRSYGGKSLGRSGKTGAVKIQGKKPGGLKAVTQSARGLQEIFILTRAGDEERIATQISHLRG
tara:strand:+ start:172 stop:408 length:237 start_codon:yes stop_codon:yes gene_type:complete